MSYDNTNTGMLSRNDRQEPGSKQPDFKGFCDIEGRELWISGWIREAGPNSKTPGRKFFSLRFEPKNPPAQAGAPATGGQAPTPPPFDDDDIPF